MVQTVGGSVENVQLARYVTGSMDAVHLDVNNGGFRIFVRLLSVNINKRDILYTSKDDQLMILNDNCLLSFSFTSAHKQNVSYPEH